MKKSDIVALVQGGVLNVTQHSVSVNHAYKVFKFKSTLRKLFEALVEQEQDLAKECLIMDGASFDARRSELAAKEKPTKEEQKELEEMNDQYKRFAGLREELYKEEVLLAGVKTIPYEEWHKLQEENKEVQTAFGKQDVLSGQVEDLLENVLWRAPEESEEEVE